MNDVHTFFADCIHRSAEELNGEYEGDLPEGVLNRVNHALQATKWMIECLNSTSTENEISIIASGVLQEK